MDQYHTNSTEAWTQRSSYTHQRCYYPMGAMQRFKDLMNIDSNIARPLYYKWRITTKTNIFLHLELQLWCLQSLLVMALHGEDTIKNIDWNRYLASPPGTFSPCRGRSFLKMLVSDLSANTSGACPCLLTQGGLCLVDSLSWSVSNSR